MADDKTDANPYHLHSGNQGDQQHTATDNGTLGTIHNHQQQQHPFQVESSPNTHSNNHHPLNTTVDSTATTAIVGSTRHHNHHNHNDNDNSFVSVLSDWNNESSKLATSFSAEDAAAAASGVSPTSVVGFPSNNSTSNSTSLDGSVHGNNNNTYFANNPSFFDQHYVPPAALAGVGSSSLKNLHGQSKATSSSSSPKEVIVIAKSYYVSHSLRHANLFQVGKPEDLKIASTTWYEIQTQLAPLIKRHLFLPKSYWMVPAACLVASLAWFVCCSIALSTTAATAASDAATAADASSSSSSYNNGYDNSYNNYNNGAAADATTTSTTSTTTTTAGSLPATLGWWLVLWVAVYLLLLTPIFLAFGRWMGLRNAPVDDELRHVCWELSRSKTQAEGYRLDYIKCGPGVFATRVLRFTPLPVPDKIQIPTPTRKTIITAVTTAGEETSQQRPPPPSQDVEALSTEAAATATTTTTMASQQPPLQIHQLSSSSYPMIPFNNNQDGVIRMIPSTLSDTTGDEYSTLQSLTMTGDAVRSPFPTSDEILENVGSVLFVLVVVQCVLHV